MMYGGKDLTTILFCYSQTYGQCFGAAYGEGGIRFVQYEQQVPLATQFFQDGVIHLPVRYEQARHLCLHVHVVAKTALASWSVFLEVEGHHLDRCGNHLDDRRISSFFAVSFDPFE